MNPLLAQAEGLKTAAICFVVVAVILGAYHHGRQFEAGKVAKERQEQQATILRLQEERQIKADELALANAAHRAAAAPRERLITKEVIRYEQVTKPADRCSLPGTWRLRHDAAATGVPLTAESGSVATGSASPVDDAAALETVADNYATARGCLDRLAAWQRRYAAVERAGR